MELDLEHIGIDETYSLDHINNIAIQLRLKILNRAIDNLKNKKQKDINDLEKLNDDQLSKKGIVTRLDDMTKKTLLFGYNSYLVYSDDNQKIADNIEGLRESLAAQYGEERSKQKDIHIYSIDKNKTLYYLSLNGEETQPQKIKRDPFTDGIPAVIKKLSKYSGGHNNQLHELALQDLDIIASNTDAPVFREGDRERVEKCDLLIGLKAAIDKLAPASIQLPSNRQNMFKNDVIPAFESLYRTLAAQALNSPDTKKSLKKDTSHKNFVLIANHAISEATKTAEHPLDRSVDDVIDAAIKLDGKLYPYPPHNLLLLKLCIFTGVLIGIAAGMFVGAAFGAALTGCNPIGVAAGAVLGFIIGGLAVGVLGGLFYDIYIANPLQLAYRQERQKNNTAFSEVSSLNNTLKKWYAPPKSPCFLLEIFGFEGSFGKSSSEQKTPDIIIDYQKEIVVQ
jgi:hypothetical protein